MDSILVHPIKLYIQDIFRAEPTEQKYIYKIFGKSFKNVKIHGVITQMRKNSNSINFELSDPTGSVQIYYDYSKCNIKISSSCMNDLTWNFARISKISVHDRDVETMHFMLDKIEKQFKNPMSLAEGDFLSVLGDIFIEDLKNMRMIAAYECKKTSLKRDIVWLEELKYMYDKSYNKM